MTTAQRTATLRELWPLLTVHDIQRSIAFYRDKLGFEVIAAAPADGTTYWCRLTREGCSLMLQQADDEDGPAAGRGRGVSLYLLCDDVDVLHAELAAKGLLLQPPSDAYYGMRQLFIPEPDGYALCFECQI